MCRWGDRVTRTLGEVDRELALLATARALYGGSVDLTDQLLDERNESRTAAGPLRTEQRSPGGGP